MMSGFDIEKALIPVWDTDYVYSESVMFVRDSLGKAAAPLLYDIDEIISVKSATELTEYEYGRDFVFEGNKITLTDNSRIFSFTYDELYPENPVEGHSFPMEKGNVLFYEETFFHKRQISITYKAKNKSALKLKPRSSASLLPESHKKLSEGHLSLCIYGDSISVGANATKFTGIEPFCPPYSELFTEGLRIRYSADISYHNPSKGGMNSEWGLDNAEKLVKDFNPDLCVLAFGANDSGTPAEKVIDNLSKTVSTIRSFSSECEFIVISECLPNKLLSSEKCRFYGNQPSFEKPIVAMERQGVAVCNITDFQRKLLTRKRFIDLTGNNVNHPNDFFHRLHAQYLLSVFNED